MKICLILFFNILFLAFPMCGQDSLSFDSQKTDVFDVLSLLSKHKKEVSEKSITVSANKDKMTLIPGLGYSQLLGFTILLEGNYSFRTSPNSNVSVIRFVPQVGLKGYILPRMTSSIWFLKNKMNFTSDWRFYRYIVVDYGIGSSSNKNNFNNYGQNYFRLHQTISWEKSHNLLFGLGYNFDSHARIKRIEPEINTPQYDNIDITKSTISSGIVLNMLYDNRKNENFPYGGETFAIINYVQNLKFIGSTYNYPVLSFDLRKYFQIGDNELNVLAIRSLDYFLFNKKAPYFDQPWAQGDILNTSYRPYIEGRFRGNNCVYLEGDYRFNITRNNLIGGALFFDAGSFTEFSSNKFERINIGYGFSGRLLINKKSNVYFVASYGWGNSGGQGIFFNLGDTF